MATFADFFVTAAHIKVLSVKIKVHKSLRLFVQQNHQNPL